MFKRPMIRVQYDKDMVELDCQAVYYSEESKKIYYFKAKGKNNDEDSRKNISVAKKHEEPSAGKKEEVIVEEKTRKKVSKKKLSQETKKETVNKPSVVKKKKSVAIKETPVIKEEKTVEKETLNNIEPFDLDILTSPIKNDEIIYLTNDFTEISPVLLSDINGINDLKVLSNKHGIIKLSKELNYIPRQMFYDIDNIIYIIIPHCVNELREKCFAGTNITEFELPDNIKVIERNVFNGCKDLKVIKYKGKIYENKQHLEHILLFNDVIVDYNAFKNCGLEE